MVTEDIKQCFEQSVAESQNDMANESALDLMRRTEQFALELQALVQKYQDKMPDVLINGILMGNISHRASLLIRWQRRSQESTRRSDKTWNGKKKH